MYQAGVALKDLLHRDPQPAEYHAVPSVTFTDPEVASVGMTADQAATGGLEARIGYADLTRSSRGFVYGLQRGFVKLVEHRGTLIGATVVGPAAGEICSMLTLAVHARLDTSTLASMIYAYPTSYRAIESAVAAIPGT